MSIVKKATTKSIGQRRDYLATLKKGTRTGWGKDAIITDHDYFILKPETGDERKDDIIQRVFSQEYGDQPRIIRRVHIPVDLVGNFNVEDHAWWTAYHHTRAGSTFLAKADSEWVYQLRCDDPNSPDAGRVIPYEKGELARAKITKLDKQGREGIVYNGQHYRWKAEFEVPILLPDLVVPLQLEGVFERPLIRFRSSSFYDCLNLPREFEDNIKGELASAFVSPWAPDHEYNVGMIPLRPVPLMIRRTLDTINSQKFGSNNPTERQVTKKWLLHWSIDPDYQTELDKAHAQLRSVMSQLAGSPQWLLGQRQSVNDINADLFGDTPPARALTTGEETVLETEAEEETAVIEEGEFEEVTEEKETAVTETNLTETDWVARADNAQNLDHWSAYFWDIKGVRNVFKDANQVKRGVIHMLGEHFDARDNAIRREAMMKYVNAKADKATHEEAMNLAKKYYTQASVPF